MTPSHLTLHEAFYTFQGEGVHMGRAAFFIRTQGCDQDCWFCDAAGTWHKDWKPRGLRKWEPIEILGLVEQSSPAGAMVVITGGEPCLYDLNPTIHALHLAERYVAVETAGHRPLPLKADWITCSPKPFAAHPLPENLPLCNEFKIIVSDEASLIDGLACIHGRNPEAEVWLHPEWSHRHDPKTLQLIVDYVKEMPWLRAGYQLHKLYMADLMDPAASKVAVPLGGTGAHPW
jgi:7-carboxy-7-deazaguanine synthase